jgi:hypothetical protein
MTAGNLQMEGSSMSTSKKMWPWLAAMIVCCCASLASAQMAAHPRFYGHGEACYGPDGQCAPRRVTYGYYPTSWRRWPHEGPMHAKKPETIRTPTPAKPATKPQEEPTKPRDEETRPTAPEARPEEDTMLPPPEEPETRSPPSMMPSFDEEPGQPFRESPPSDEGLPRTPLTPGPPTTPGESSPFEGLPSRSPATAPPAADDAPPTMPTDDPFKDDPPSPPPSTEGESPRGETHELPAPEKETQRIVPARWQTPNKGGQQPSPETVDAPNAIESSVAEPTLLPADHARDAKPSEEAPPDGGRQNPLRTGKARIIPKVPQPTVQQASHWVSETTEKSASKPGLRQNPLRGNSR